MFIVQNLKHIFLAALLMVAVPTLCMADDKGHARSKQGTRVNAGAHANPIGGGSLRLIVHLINPSDSPITIKEIKVFDPDGTQASPNFPAALFPVPPFDLGPYEAKGFSLEEAVIAPVNFPPLGVFQVHTTWEAEKPITGLKGYSVVVGVGPFGVVSRIAVEGFDLPDGKKESD
jgi:hypothetical protein